MPWPWASLLHDDSQQQWSNVKNKAATRDLNIKIAAGEFNSNTNDAADIGGVVSGEHFPEYEAPPHQVAKPRLSASVACSGVSCLNRNCKDSKQEQQKQEKKVRLLG
jgi:hypothetical protein